MRLDEARGGRAKSHGATWPVWGGGTGKRNERQRDQLRQGRDSQCPLPAPAQQAVELGAALRAGGAPTSAFDGAARCAASGAPFRPLTAPAARIEREQHCAAPALRPHQAAVLHRPPRHLAPLLPIPLHRHPDLPTRQVRAGRPDRTAHHGLIPPRPAPCRPAPRSRPLPWTA